MESSHGVRPQRWHSATVQPSSCTCYVDIDSLCCAGSMRRLSPELPLLREFSVALSKKPMPVFLLPSRVRSWVRVRARCGLGARIMGSKGEGVLPVYCELLHLTSLANLERGPFAFLRLAGWSEGSKSKERAQGESSAAPPTLAAFISL